MFTTADKEVPTQAAQIQNLILQGYNAIVINAGSPDALNGAIKQACDAGIVVVSFDGIVTEPCAYRVVVDFKDMGKQEVEQMAKFQPKGGNLLEIRGLAGTSIDDAIHAGILEGVKAHPDFKIVSSVTGDWDQTTAQKAVATVCPRCRPSSASSIRAATAMAPRRRSPPPASPPDHHRGQSPGRIAVVEGAKGQGRLQDLVRLDRARRLDPRILGRATGARRQQEYPARSLVPYLAFTQDDFEKELPNIPQGGVASHEYSQADAIAAIKANMK